MKLLLFAALVLLAVGGGFLLGRRFPTHHYEVSPGHGGFVFFDTTTGKLCNALKPFVEEADNNQRLKPDQLDAVQHPTLGTLFFPKTMPKDQRNQIIADMEASPNVGKPDPFSYIPACGKE
jgi:hypothetical protein